MARPLLIIGYKKLLGIFSLLQAAWSSFVRSILVCLVADKQNRSPFKELETIAEHYWNKSNPKQLVTY
jgi:hypothetical protein